MKILMLIGSGANHVTLANRLHAAVGLDGILLRTAQTKKTVFFKRVRRAYNNRVVGRPLSQAWSKMLQAQREQFSDLPLDPAVTASDINAPRVIKWIADAAPDLVLVSGTNMIRQKTIDVISRTGVILNLHTGISPYIKGGPNCTNWCLAIGRPELIGNTIMWLDSGIDSGALVATERTTLDGSETLADLHIKVMAHAHDLYVRAALAASTGQKLPNIAQDDIAEGHTFYTRDWTHSKQRAAIRFFNSGYATSLQKRALKTTLVDLERGHCDAE